MRQWANAWPMQHRLCSLHKCKKFPPERMLSVARWSGHTESADLVRRFDPDVSKAVAQLPTALRAPFYEKCEGLFESRAGKGGDFAAVEADEKNIEAHDTMSNIASFVLRRRREASISSAVAGVCLTITLPYPFSWR